MKITIPTDLSVVKKAAENRVSTFFGVQNNTLLVEHAQKRNEARDVAAGGVPSHSFSEAAEIEGVTPQELAAQILSKPNDAITVGNKRRRVIVGIRKATSVTEIDALLAPFC